MGGLTLNGEFQITYSTGNTYTIESSSAASSSASGGGSVTAKYQLNVGPEFAVPLVGWGAGGWSEGTWGNGAISTDSLRLWSQSNFGEDLVFGPRGNSIYYWDATNGLTTRAVELSTLSGASNTPTKQNFILVSDVSRFVFCFGANTLGSATQDPMLIRWSDQEDAANWTPSATNQAGDLRLSQGSEIIGALQARQEILVFTDSALYALQYVGGTVVWGSQLLSTNLSIASQNAAVFSDGITYWMGLDSFYMYDGSVKNLPCTVKRHVFTDINHEQIEQVFAGSNEGFNEIWWFYCSGTSTTIDKYVIYNYEQNIWYFGSLARSAWLDTGIRQFPVAATYSNNLVTHEDGLDNNEGSTGSAITAFITSGEFDIDDGDKFSFIRRLLPDITFEGSTADSPAATFELLPLQSSGSGRNDPLSEGGSSSGTVTRSATVPVEKYTTQVNTRVRGRQLSIKVQSDSLGVKWQLGAPRLDIRADGRR